MMLFLLTLCYASALPEAFKLMKSAVKRQTDSALKCAEVSPGHWNLQAE